MAPTASITFYSLVLFLHVAAIVIAFGVTFTYPLTGPVTARMAPRHLPWLHKMQAVIGQRIIAPAGGLALLAGIYMAIDGPWDFSEWWVTVGLVILISLLALGGRFFGPSEERLAELAERDITASGEGELQFSAEYEALNKRVAVVGAAANLAILTAIFVMVMGSRGYL